MKIDLDMLETATQLRKSEASRLKGISPVSTWRLIKQDRFNITVNGLIKNDKKFKSYKVRERK